MPIFSNVGNVTSPYRAFSSRNQGTTTSDPNDLVQNEYITTLLCFLEAKKDNLLIRQLKLSGSEFPYIPECLRDKECTVVSSKRNTYYSEDKENAVDGMGATDGGQDVMAGGSPLKLQSIVDYDDVERQLSAQNEKLRLKHSRTGIIFPLSAMKCRESLSKLVTEASQTMNCPLLCVSDPSKDRLHHLFFGYIPLTTGMFTLVTGTYQVIEKKECKSLFSRTIRQVRINSKSSSDTVIRSRCTVRYTLESIGSNYSCTDSIDDVQNYTASSSVTVNISWNNVDSILMSPPADSVANVKLNVASGDKSSVVYCLYEELQYIKGLVSGLSTGHIRWPEVARSATPSELTNKLLYDHTFNPEPEMDSESVDIGSIEPRKNLDFTDKLWPILRVCRSYTELQDVLKLIRESVARKSCPPLMVSSSNANSLARWIYTEQCGSSVGGSSTPIEIGGLQSLVVFVEIGLEKVMRDYIHAYLGCFSGLVTADKLDPFIKQNSITDKISNLTKLHSVLELSAILSGYLRLPLVTVRSVTAAALQYSVSHDSLPADGYGIDVPVAQINPVIQLQAPDVWEAEFGVKEDNNYTVVHVTKSETEHLVAFDAAVGSNESNDDKFYCTIVHNYTQDRL